MPGSEPMLFDGSARSTTVVSAVAYSGFGFPSGPSYGTSLYSAYCLPSGPTIVPVGSGLVPSATSNGFRSPFSVG